jgi:hypothetical protein
VESHHRVKYSIDPIYPETPWWHHAPTVNEKRRGIMDQLIGYNSESNAFVEAVYGIHYWIETRAPSKQALLRKTPWDWRARVCLEAPVIVMSRRDTSGVGTDRDKGTTPRIEYLNETSAEAEIEAFTRKWTLNAQQAKWCFTALEEISPVEVDHEKV